MRSQVLRSMISTFALLGFCLASCSRQTSEKESPVQQPVSRDVSIQPSTPAPAPAPKTTANWEGNAGEFASSGIKGWAWDRNKPNEAVRVDIYDGKELVATILANEAREGLVKARKGNGVHGFEYRYPLSMRDNKEHRIGICFAGTTKHLAGSPKTLVLEAPPPAKPAPSDKGKAQDSGAAKDKSK